MLAPVLAGAFFEVDCVKLHDIDRGKAKGCAKSALASATKTQAKLTVNPTEQSSAGKRQHQFRQHRCFSKGIPGTVVAALSILPRASSVHI